VVSREGYLWKKGNKLQFWSKRWYLLSGNCIYYYAHQKDIRPRGVIFVTGCVVEKVPPPLPPGSVTDGLTALDPILKPDQRLLWSGNFAPRSLHWRPLQVCCPLSVSLLTSLPPSRLSQARDTEFILQN
jgi:hypothetical protein